MTARMALMIGIVVIFGGPDRLRQGYGGPPQLYAEAESPAYVDQSGTVSGSVVSGTDARPVRLAVVTLSSSSPSFMRGAVTDDAGRFSFAAVPAGSFTLRASKAAHIPSAFGARRPGGPGTSVTVAAGEQVRDLRIDLPRGAVITGIVRDAAGQPVPNTSVSAIRVAELIGQGRLLRPEEVLTDDRGIYRIFGLMPGDYVVSATPRVTGIGEMGARTAAEVDATFRDLQTGRGIGAAAAATAGAAAASQQGYAFASTFHPSAIAPAEAARVRLTAGEERQGVDIAVQLVRTATIAGTVTSPDGAPLSSVRVGLQSDAALLMSSPNLPLGAGGAPDATGAFQIPGVIPGRYRLVARTMPGRGGASSDLRWAAADIIVTGEDISALALTLRPGLQVTGKMIVEAVGDAPSAPATNELLVRLDPEALAASDGPSYVITAVSSTASGGVRPDGTFVVPGVMPGRYRPAVFTKSPLKGWLLESAMVNGRDALDHGLEVDAQDVTGAVLTFTNRHTQLTGTLQTPAGQPAIDYVVIAFPADRTLWRPRARRIQTTRPDTAGLFTFRGLPPGDYRIAALTDLEPDQSHDPDFLATLVPASIALTLKAGENRNQDLRIGGDPVPQR